MNNILGGGEEALHAVWKLITKIHLHISKVWAFFSSLQQFVKEKQISSVIPSSVHSHFPSAPLFRNGTKSREKSGLNTACDFAASWLCWRPGDAAFKRWSLCCFGRSLEGNIQLVRDVLCYSQQALNPASPGWVFFFMLQYLEKGALEGSPDIH